MIKKEYNGSRIVEIKVGSLFSDKLLDPISLIDEYIVLQIEVVDHSKYIAEIITKEEYNKFVE